MMDFKFSSTSEFDMFDKFGELDEHSSEFSIPDADMFDEFGELDEHFFDDDGNGTDSANSEAENDDELLTLLAKESEWPTFDFPDIDESESSLFTNLDNLPTFDFPDIDESELSIDAWTNLGNRFDTDLPLGTSTNMADVNDSQNDLSTFDFDDEELSNLIKRASTLFSRSDVEKVAGILDMQPVSDVKIKGYSI